MWDIFAIWELREGLGEPTVAISIMNCNVIVATEWILQAGEHLFKRQYEVVTEDEVQVAKQGTLYQGKIGLPRERWDFWRERFIH